MSGLNGNQTAKKLRDLKLHNDKIIFLTSYPQYMLESFDFIKIHAVYDRKGLISSYGFLQVHRSVFINLHHVMNVIARLQLTHRVNTGNLAMDALLTNALSIGQDNGIRMDTELQLYNHKFNIERYDLSVVLGNMH